MLLKFTVENFASIGKKQTINLMSGKARGKKEHLLKYYNQNALRFASIYGANASGKTTIVRAMHFGKKMIKNGYLDKRYMTPNKSDIEWIDKPTEFKYTVFIDNKIYEYGFTLFWKKQQVIKEWLVEQNSRNIRKTIFIRDFVADHFKLSVNSNDEELQNRLLMYFSDASKEENMLFLNDINSGKGNLFTMYPSLLFLRDIYRWFVTKLKFVYPNNNDLGEYSFLYDQDKNEELYNYLDCLDIPITEMTYKDITKEQAFKDVAYEAVQNIEDDFKKMHQQAEIDSTEVVSVLARINDDYLIIDANAEGFQKIQTVEFTHGKYGNYDFKEESDGTKRILELVEILTSPEEDITYVVDEIDRSLHPLLTEQFILMYLNPNRVNKKQLIITTHESRLLNLNHLRKDEIYFSTNINGETTLVRFDEYESSDVRTDINIQTAYLRGRYNAIPIFTTCEGN